MDSDVDVTSSMPSLSSQQDESSFSHTPEQIVKNKFKQGGCGVYNTHIKRQNIHSNTSLASVGKISNAPYTWSNFPTENV